MLCCVPRFARGHGFVSVFFGLNCIPSEKDHRHRLDWPSHLRGVNAARCLCDVEMERFELLTPCLQGRCSPS